MLRTFCVAMLLVGCSSPMMTTDAGSDAGGFIDAGPVCLDDDAGVIDAGTGDGGDFSCMGRPAATRATASVTIPGFVTNAGLTRNPIPGALVELFDSTGALVDSELTSADGGRYAVTATTGCAPFDGSMRASKPDAGYYDVWYYPAAPWQRSRSSLELTIFDDSARNLVAAIAGVMIADGGAALAIGIDDCGGFPVSGATVSSNPPGTVRYVSEAGLPNTMLTATSSKGQALIFSVPAGNVSVTATVNGQAIKTKTFNARPDAISTTTLTP